MVFETASGRAATLQRLGDGLDQAHRVLAEWQGEAGEAFRADVGRIRRDIEADGVESQRVAAAVSRAEADVSACKRELEDVERAAAVNGWAITSDWRIDVGDAWIGRDPIGLAAEQQVLQDELTACKVHAHAADHELATAIGAAVGEVSLDGVGVSPGGVVPRQGVPDVSGVGRGRGKRCCCPAGPPRPGQVGSRLRARWFPRVAGVSRRRCATCCCRPRGLSQPVLVAKSRRRAVCRIC